MRQDQLARSRALTRLAKRYPSDFSEILDAERAAIDLPPLGTTPPGPKPKVNTK